MTPSILIRVAAALMVGATFLPAQSKPSAQGGGPAKARAEAPSAGDKAQVRLAEVMAMLQDEALTPAQRAEATKKLEEVMAALAAEKMAEAKAAQEPKAARKVVNKVHDGVVVEEVVTSHSSDSKVVRDSQSSSSSSSDKKSSSDQQSASDKKSSSDEKKARSEGGKGWKSVGKAEGSDGAGKAEGGEDKPVRLRLRRSNTISGSEPQEPAPATAPEASKPPKAPRAPKAPKVAVTPSSSAEPVDVRVLESGSGELHVVYEEGQKPVLLRTESGELVVSSSEPQEPAPAKAPEASKPPKAPRAPKAPKAPVAPAEPAEPAESVEFRVLEVAPGELQVVRRQGQDPIVLRGQLAEIKVPDRKELQAELELLAPKILEEVRVALPESLGEGSEALRIARLELEKRIGLEGVRGQLGTEVQEAMAEAREQLERARAEQHEGVERARVEMLRYRDSLQQHEGEKRARANALRAQEEAKRVHDEALRGHDEAMRARANALRAQEEAKRAHDEALRGHDEAMRAHDEAMRSHERAARAHDEAMAAAEEDGARGQRGRRVVVDRAKGQRAADDRQTVERVYELRTRSVDGQDDEIRRLIDEMRGEMREIRSLMQELRERADQAHERRTGRAGRYGGGLLGGQRAAGSFPASAEGDAVGTSPFGSAASGNALVPAAPGSVFGSGPMPAQPPAPPAPSAPGDAGVGVLPPLETRGVPVLRDLPVLGGLFTTRNAPAPASTLPPVETRPLGR